MSVATSEQVRNAPKEYLRSSYWPSRIVFSAIFPLHWFTDHRSFDVACTIVKRENLNLLSIRLWSENKSHR